MLKSKLFSLLLLFFTIFSFSQTRLPGASNGGGDGTVVDLNKESALKSDIDDVGLSVANKLMSCCTTFGGNNLYSEVDYSNVRQNKITGAFTVPMTIGWYGSLSGTHYWIKGKLIINSNGSKEWLKITDSNNFLSKAGCSKNCIY